MAKTTKALASLLFGMILLTGWSFTAAEASSVVPCGNGSYQSSLGEQCDDGNTASGDGCSAACQIEAGFDCNTAQNPTVCVAIVCGNGITQTGEQCDDGNTANGDCCSAACSFESAATVCRASGGVCDTPETCTGSTGTCPVDAKSTAECRASQGECDVAESCDGISNNCPDDLKSTAECRPVGGACDPDGETCDGTSNTCPTDTFAVAGTPCRPAAGDCDLPETCTGASGDCPADAKSTAECRASQGDCDLAESCDGSSDDCPADLKSTDECRASQGECDLAESCDGSSDDCPADLKSTAECRPDGGECDPAGETCDGTSNTCPSDSLAAAGTPCRAAAGVCDLPETCTGASADCPADAKSTAECRPAEGVCDLAESCDGLSDDCPADEKSEAVCRPAVHPDCDVAESCNGTDNNCPDDQLLGCADDDGVACTEATCQPDGECIIADTCVEVCRGAGFWQNHSGDEKGENIGQDVVDSVGGINVCGQIVDSTTSLNNMDSILEGLCIRVQGVKERRLYRQVLTAALNCSISEGGTCEMITDRFIDVSFDECNALCAGTPVEDGPTLQDCVEQLGCFNSGGRIVDGQCAKGTCEGDSKVLCGADYGDCADASDCVKFEDACTRTELCNEDLDAPASICPQSLAASSPKACREARQNDCTIDQCF